MQLKQVKALVTGGVSGLGLATVRHILANGGKCGRRPEGWDGRAAERIAAVIATRFGAG